MFLAPELGFADGLPGDTVGPAAVGATIPGVADAGLALGEPGVTVGPSAFETPEVGLPELGAAKAGLNGGLPGATVNPMVIGAKFVGPAAAGARLKGNEGAGLTLAEAGSVVGRPGSGRAMLGFVEVGLADGLPGINVGATVVGASFVLGLALGALFVVDGTEVPMVGIVALSGFVSCVVSVPSVVGAAVTMPVLSMVSSKDGGKVGGGVAPGIAVGGVT